VLHLPGAALCGKLPFTATVAAAVTACKVSDSDFFFDWVALFFPFAMLFFLRALANVGSVVLMRLATLGVLLRILCLSQVSGLIAKMVT